MDQGDKRDIKILEIPTIPFIHVKLLRIRKCERQNDL